MLSRRTTKERINLLVDLEGIPPDLQDPIENLILPIINLKFDSKIDFVKSVIEADKNNVLSSLKDCDVSKLLKCSQALLCKAKQKINIRNKISRGRSTNFL